jgi:hypothetical protein
MRSKSIVVLYAAVLFFAIIGPAHTASEATRSEVLKNLESARAELRLSSVERLGRVGLAGDTEVLVSALAGLGTLR